MMALQKWLESGTDFPIFNSKSQLVGCQRNIVQMWIVDSWETQPPSLPSELYKRQIYIEFLNKLTCLPLACNFSWTDSLPSPTSPTAHICSGKFCLRWSCTSVLTHQAVTLSCYLNHSIRCGVRWNNITSQECVTTTGQKKKSLKSCKVSATPTLYLEKHIRFSFDLWPALNLLQVGFATSSKQCTNLAMVNHCPWDSNTINYPLITHYYGLCLHHNICKQLTAI